MSFICLLVSIVSIQNSTIISFVFFLDMSFSPHCFLFCFVFCSLRILTLMCPYVSVCSFLYINSACYFLNFLKLWVNVSYLVLENSPLYFFRYFCCIILYLSLYGTLIIHILDHWTACHISLKSCSVFPFLIFFCASFRVISTDTSLLCPVISLSGCFLIFYCIFQFNIVFKKWFWIVFKNFISLLKFCIFHSFCLFFINFLYMYIFFNMCIVVILKSSFVNFNMGIIYRLAFLKCFFLFIMGHFFLLFWISYNF